MKPFLFSYVSGGERKYKLIYAKTEKEAEDKLKEEIFYLSNPYIQPETIL